MTVKELKEELNKFPDDMDVFIHQRYDEFAYVQPEVVEVREVLFQDGRLKAKDSVLVITDDN